MRRPPAASPIAAHRLCGAALALLACGAPGNGSGGAARPAPADTPASATPAAVASPAAAVAAGAGAASDTLRPRAMRPLAADDHLHTATTSLLDEAEVRVLRDAAAWQRTWAQLMAGQAPTPPPAVDFARDMVVLVADGQRSSGGHAIRVDGTAAGAGDTLVLHATRTAPGEGCMSTMVMTAPIDVVRVPRHAGPVRLAVRLVATPC